MQVCGQPHSEGADALLSERGKELLSCAPRIRLRVAKSTALHLFGVSGQQCILFCCVQPLTALQGFKEDPWGGTSC